MAFKVASVSSGKLVVSSVSPGSLGVGPRLPRSIPRKPLSRIRLPRMNVVAFGLEMTMPRSPLLAMTLASRASDPPIRTAVVALTATPALPFPRERVRVTSVPTALPVITMFPSRMPAMDTPKNRLPEITLASTRALTTSDNSTPVELPMALVPGDVHPDVVVGEKGGSRPGMLGLPWNDRR